MNIIMTESLAEPPGNLESISRHEIGAPAGYVSVYHETTADRLPSIERIGIRSGFKERNIGSFGTTDTVNQLFDQDRPERLATLGVSRRTNTFAYYSLAFGFSLGSAAQRYVRYSKNELHQQYAVMKENDPEVLAALGVKTSKEYECKVQDPGYLRERYPGEVLELTVDPVRSYVGDLAHLPRLPMKFR